MDTKQKLDDFVLKMNKSGKILPSHYGTLTELLLEFFLNPENWGEGMQFLLRFPAKVVGIAFARIYENLDESGRDNLLEMWLTLQDSKHLSESRQLHMVKSVLRVDQEVSWKLLVDLCLKLTNINEKVPSDKVLRQFHTELVASSILFIFPLDVLQPLETEYAALTSCLLHALATQSDLDWHLVQAEVDKAITWMATYSKPIRFPKVQRRSVEKVTMPWPKEYKERLLGLGFLESVVYVAKLDTENDPLVEQPTNGSFDIDAWIGELKLHWDSLSANSQESVHLRNERDSEVRARLLVEEKLAASEEKLRTAHAYVARLEQQVQEMRAESAEKDRLVQKAREQFEQEKNKLTDLTEQESQVVADQFRNKLSQRLRFEYQDFRDIINEPMTEALGDNLRAQLAGIFDFLSMQGIKL